MKELNRNIVFRGFLLFFTISFLLVSCDQDSLDTDGETDTQLLSKAETQTEIDNISESLNDIDENIFLSYGSSTSSKEIENKEIELNKYMPDCVVITKVITKTHKSITIDYGDGCTTKNDNFLSGKISLDISLDFDSKSASIDYTFDNFYFNNKKIEGDIHKLRSWINENGNPQAIINKDIKIIWEDGSFVTVKGERKREWIEGFENHIWGDNVFLITGTWTVNQKDGNERTVKIIEPLKRKTACRFIVSGVVEIQKNDRVVSVNYGSGDCDDLAIATFNGIDHEIHIRKRK